MKKIYLILALLLHVGLASAQWSVSPEVGLSVLRHNGQFDDWRPAVKIGAAVEYGLKPNFSIESGLFYTQRGYSMAGWVSNENWPQALLERPSLVRHMFQVPVMGRFAFDVTDDIRLFVGAGPYIGFYFANDWKQTFQYRNANAGDVFDWGFTFMTGLEFGRFYVRVAYDMALGGEPHGVALNYNVGTLSVGYKF